MEFNQDKAIFLQVAEMIENQILDGALDIDEQAPSTNEFARIYQINPATARKGLNILIDEEILYKKRGMGMYVKEGAVEKIAEKRQAEFFENYIPTLIREAKRLNISMDKLIDRIKESEDEKGAE